VLIISQNTPKGASQHAVFNAIAKTAIDRRTAA